MNRYVVAGCYVDMHIWWHYLDADQRDELRALKDRHTSQRFILRFEYDVVDCPILRLICLVKQPNALGDLVAVPDEDCSCGSSGQPVHLKTHTVELALREPLSEWWQPIERSRPLPPRWECR